MHVPRLSNIKPNTEPDPSLGRPKSQVRGVSEIIVLFPAAVNPSNLMIKLLPMKVCNEKKQTGKHQKPNVSYGVCTSFLARISPIFLFPLSPSSSLNTMKARTELLVVLCFCFLLKARLITSICLCNHHFRIITTSSRCLVFCCL